MGFKARSLGALLLVHGVAVCLSMYDGALHSSEHDQCEEDM